MTKVLTCKQTCDTLGISRTTLYRLTQRGVFSKIKISDGRVGWLEDELDQYVRDQAIILRVA
jgi:predicted DNA-binding transcriptional regulator AlpA